MFRSLCFFSAPLFFPPVQLKFVSYERRRCLVMSSVILSRSMKIQHDISSATYASVLLLAYPRVFFFVLTEKVFFYNSCEYQKLCFINNTSQRYFITLNYFDEQLNKNCNILICLTIFFYLKLESTNLHFNLNEFKELFYLSM